MQRDRMEFDAVIVGGGPAGLAAAIRLRQLAQRNGRNLSVCLIDKGAEIGAHILSGNVFDPRALDELLPDWREAGAPVTTAATDDRFLLLGARRAVPLPVPPAMRNRGNFVISLADLCRWLAERAEALGVDIFPGFPASDVLYDETGRVVGVATADMGRDRDGGEGPTFAPGVELRAPVTLFAEGCRGSLAGTLVDRFALAGDADPQTYGLGVKEIWEVAPDRHQPGQVLHTVGWPLDRSTYGGGFLYHMDANRVAVGLVVGLDYANPYLDPFEEMQRLKTHPAIRPVFEGGRRLAFGARTLVEGGLQALPRLVFPGGALIGDAAGFLDVARIKGAHTAIKTGMLAAEAAYAGDLDTYPDAVRGSWVWDDLHRARNLRPGFRWGLWGGLLHAAVDALLLRGRAPWTLHHRARDRDAIASRAGHRPIDYPRPDGAVTFDRPSSVHLSNTNHRDDEPCHLIVGWREHAASTSLDRFAGPEQRYCPAGVYEFVDEDGAPRLQVNAQNCVHCKTCDIKDPADGITWTVPEGGGGPNYPEM